MRRKVVIRRDGIDGNAIRVWLGNGSSDADYRIKRMTTVEHQRLVRMVVLSSKPLRLADITRWSLQDWQLLHWWGRL